MVMVTKLEPIRKQKVLYIITKADVGGAQKYVADLAANLDTDLFETKILCGGRDLKWLSNKLFIINDILAVAELIKIFRTERPDIVHLNSSKAGVVGSVAAKFYNLLKFSVSGGKYQKLKVIFTAHGWVFNPDNYLNRPVSLGYRLVHKLAAFAQDAIINVSDYDREIALRYNIAPAEKLVTIHNGIDAKMGFLDKQTARKEIIKKLEIGNWKLEINRPWIGSIGRLTKEKNYQTLIKAASLVPNAYFFIIGSGTEISNLKSQILNLKLENKFFILPPTGSDSVFLKAFDVFTMSSIKEGLPYVMLEAASAAMPIVSTDAGGIPEIIQNQESGIVVPKGNADKLAEAIKTIIGNPNYASKLGRRAQLSCASEFNLQTMIEKTQQVYLNLI